MSSNSSKWLTGCAIGCGAVIVLLIIIGTSGYVFIKGRLQRFEEAKTATSDLEAKYGKIQDFIAEPDGRIKPERIEAFLTVRESMASSRRKLEGSLGRISQEIGRARAGEKKTFWEGIRMVGEGLSIVPELGEFFADRSRALLDSQMGMGEYCYIYVVSYYSWLGKSPEDGPEFRLQGDEGANIGVRDTSDVREERRDAAVRWIRRTFLAMFRNQLGRMKAQELTSSQVSWRKSLESEIAALESNRSQLPWQDSLPEAIVTSLKPFRARLEASYSAILNPLELGSWSESRRALGRNEQDRGKR